MPLHAHNPVRAAGPLDSLNNPVRRMRGDAQAAPGALNGLVVRAIDQRVGAAGKLFDAAPRFQPGIVDGVVCGLRWVLFAMPDVCVHLAVFFNDTATTE